MKIFISWSGERSLGVAKLLDKWIQCVIQAVDPWLSSKDIDRGSLWFTEISNQLANTHNGIVCLTKSNLNKPWILFESGALAKGLSSNRVFTFLVDLEPNDVKDPLAQFNHTMPYKESLYGLVRSINNGLGDDALKEDIISSVFETYWPQFEEEFQHIIKETPEEDIEEIRPQDDLLNEVLSSVRGIDKRLRQIESNKNPNFIKRSSPLKKDKQFNSPLGHIIDKNLTKHLIDSFIDDGKSPSEIVNILDGMSKVKSDELLNLANDSYFSRTLNSDNKE